MGASSWHVQFQMIFKMYINYYGRAVFFTFEKTHFLKRHPVFYTRKWNILYTSKNIHKVVESSLIHAIIPLPAVIFAHNGNSPPPFCQEKNTDNFKEIVTESRGAAAQGAPSQDKTSAGK